MAQKSMPSGTPLKYKYTSLIHGQKLHLRENLSMAPNILVLAETNTLTKTTLAVS